MQESRMLPLITMIITACTGPAQPSPTDQPTRMEVQRVTALCLPEPAELSSSLRGQMSQTGVDTWTIDCGDAFAWPCERGVECSSDGGCVCRCDVDYVDNDCGRVALAQWFPGVFDAWSFSCQEERCVVSGSQVAD